MGLRDKWCPKLTFTSQCTILETIFFWVICLKNQTSFKKFQEVKPSQTIFKEEYIGMGEQI
jgi:hypothetical protein